MVKNTRHNRHTNKKQHGLANDKKIKVGMVYADWCGHCQHLKPEWAKMKNVIMKNPLMRKQCEIMEIESADPNLQGKLNKINQSVHGKKVEVAGYPTVFMIKGGNSHMYDGARDASALVSWVKDAMNGPANNNVMENMNVMKNNTNRPAFTFGGKKRRTQKRKNT